MKNRNKYLGCLLGGAVGDALGFAVEFMSERSIFSVYGSEGITGYAPNESGIAFFSDDTQMTMFTANGLLYAAAKSMSYIDGIALCYRDWLDTQWGDFATGKPRAAWLGNLAEMYSRRAPGNTCIGSLRQKRLGSVKEPINNSKGCGGVMRVAPIGLFFDEEDMSGEDVFNIAAEAAALTHGHDLGYLSAGVAAYMVYRLAHFDCTLEQALKEGIDSAAALYSDAPHITELKKLLISAAELAESEISDIKAIHILGEGWVGEETLAIAVFCALRHKDDFEKAMIASVNHNGDSDSTGAVTGNILGAFLGADAIPEKFTNTLEQKNILTELAGDLLSWKDDSVISSGTWKAKYLEHTYPVKK